MALVSISTDFPVILLPSTDRSVEVRLRILCASSIIVICRSLLFASVTEVTLYSLNRIIRIPIISDFVSCDPTRLKSIIVFSSKRILSGISSDEKISPFIPFVNDSIRVTKDPI